MATTKTPIRIEWRFPWWWRCIAPLAYLHHALGLPFDAQRAIEAALRRSRWRVRNARGRCGRWHHYGETA